MRVLARDLMMVIACAVVAIGAPAAKGQTAPAPAPAPAAQAAASLVGDPVQLARDAYVRKDRPRLAQARDAALEARHPLAAWADYWDLSLRLDTASASDVDAFNRRWPGSFFEDRLRNDWLLELGKRRDWAAVRREYPRFRMNDDLEVRCYAQLANLTAGPGDVNVARAAWLAQRDSDDGCQLLAQALIDARLIGAADVWRKTRWLVERGRPRAAQATVGLLGAASAKTAGEMLDNPARFLTLKAPGLTTDRDELVALALGRMALRDPVAAAAALEQRWAASLPAEATAWVWAIVAKSGALSQNLATWGWAENAWRSLPASRAAAPDWSDETLHWMARIALRWGTGDERWLAVLRAIAAMDADAAADEAWPYWRARALQATAKAGEAGNAQREQARQILAQLAGQMHFYGQLAAADLGLMQALPPPPRPASAAERAAARAHPGLQRALTAFDAGLRSEAVREWNFSLMGLSDRELLAAAELACERQIWDRCINTSEKTRSEINFEQRFPMPLRDALTAQARQAGLDPAFAYGLIRQESRFVLDARSSAGATGLMQIMPATARWTARKIGLSGFQPRMAQEQDTNLRLGTAYLRLVLDDMDGSEPLAAAAYNAGPNRSRRWREGATLEPAMWIESVPLHETRGYIKKVISNATYYSAVISGAPASIKARLGGPIGPRAANQPEPVPDLP